MRTRGKATPLLQFAMLQSIADMDSESRLGAFLRLPLRLIPRNQILKVRGGVNKGARWLAGSSIHGCWLGTYERDKQDLVEKLVRPGMVVWDIGANAGFYSIAFSKLVGARGAVYAFEPLAENVKNILKHVALNEVENVTVMQGALGERWSTTETR